MSSFVLGLDLGTSSVKAILIEQSSGEVSQEASRSLSSEHVWVPDVPNARERTVEEILSRLDDVMRTLDDSRLRRVGAVGVCGQMHGCVLWKDEVQPLSKPYRTGSTSNLITWQDGRCSPEFLSSLPPTRQPVAVSTGYGCATLAWLQRHQPGQLRSYSRAGTIMDLVVWLLCSPEKTQMSAQNATSWGYFDMKQMQWEIDV